MTELRTAPLRRSIHDRARMIATGVAMLAVTWIVVAVTDARLTRPERALFRAVNDLPDGLRALLGPAMWFGTLTCWIVVVPLIGIAYRRLAPAVAVALGCWSSYLAAQIVKSVVGRGRPEVFLDVLYVRAVADGAGYASGHAAVAAGAAAALAPWLGRTGRIIVWILAALVAIARVYVGVHLPLDVVGGLAIGLVCGSVATTVVGTPDDGTSA